jgi:hypothetical protein
MYPLGEIESSESELPRLSWVKYPLGKQGIILLMILFEQML